MFRPPFLIRVAVGLTAEAIDRSRALVADATKLPGDVVTWGLGAALAAQQQLTQLAARGEVVLEDLFDAPAEEPEWAVFDEDADPEVLLDAARDGGSAPLGTDSDAADEA